MLINIGTLQHSYPYLVAPCLLDLPVTPGPAGLALLSDPCNLRTDTTTWISVWRRCCKNACGHHVQLVKLVQVSYHKDRLCLHLPRDPSEQSGLCSLLEEQPKPTHSKNRLQVSVQMRLLRILSMGRCLCKSPRMKAVFFSAEVRYAGHWSDAHSEKQRRHGSSGCKKKPQQCLFMTTRLGWVIHREKTSITKKTNKQTNPSSIVRSEGRFDLSNNLDIGIVSTMVIDFTHALEDHKRLSLLNQRVCFNLPVTEACCLQQHAYKGSPSPCREAKS